MPTASIRARNSLVSFTYANSTLRTLLSSFQFDQKIAPSPLSFFGIDMFSKITHNCQGNYTNMCRMLEATAAPAILERLGVDGCCSGVWAQFSIGSRSTLIPRFPKLEGSGLIDIAMRQTNADFMALILILPGRLVLPTWAGKRQVEIVRNQLLIKLAIRIMDISNFGEFLAGVPNIAMCL